MKNEITITPEQVEAIKKRLQKMSDLAEKREAEGRKESSKFYDGQEYGIEWVLDLLHIEY